MRNLLERFVVRSRLQAILAATLTLVAPLTGLLTLAIVGLVTLKFGVADGAIVLAAATALASVFTFAVFHTAQPTLEFALLLGAPVLVLAAALRFSSSQGVTLLVAAAMGAVAVLGVQIVTSDPVAWWREVLEQVSDRLVDRERTDPEVLAQLDERLDQAAPAMVSVPIVPPIIALLVLFVSRWWHAMLDNPGGFGREFRALRVDRRVAPVAIGVSAAAIALSDTGLGSALLQVTVIIYLIQGVAVVHALVNGRRLNSGWLITLYVTLTVGFLAAAQGIALLALVWSLTVLALAVTGLSDTWMDYRRRFGANA